MTDQTVPNGEKGPSEDRLSGAPATFRSGRAISSPTPVNTAVSPSGGPSSDDCYTSLLHNPDHDRGSSVGKPSGKQPGDCYTNDLHKRSHIMWRTGRLYYRRRVPTSLRSIVGKREVWRSLGTDSPTVALRRSHQIAASIERCFCPEMRLTNRCCVKPLRTCV